MKKDLNCTTAKSLNALVFGIPAHTASNCKMTNWNTYLDRMWKEVLVASSEVLTDTAGGTEANHGNLQTTDVLVKDFETMAFQTQSTFCFTDDGSVKGTHSKLHYVSADKLLISSGATLLPGKIGSSF